MSDSILKDVAFIAEMPSIAVNKAYVTVAGGIGRLTFTEVFTTDIEAPRVAVSMTVEAMTGIRDAMSESLRICAQQAIENHACLN